MDCGMSALEPGARSRSELHFKAARSIVWKERLKASFKVKRMVLSLSSSQKEEEIGTVARCHYKHFV